MFIKAIRFSFSLNRLIMCDYIDFTESGKPVTQVQCSILENSARERLMILSRLMFTINVIIISIILISRIIEAFLPGLTLVRLTSSATEWNQLFQNFRKLSTIKLNAICIVLSSADIKEKTRFLCETLSEVNEVSKRPTSEPCQERISEQVAQMIAKPGSMQRSGRKRRLHLPRRDPEANTIELREINSSTENDELSVLPLLPPKGHVAVPPPVPRKNKPAIQRGLQ